MVVRRRIHESRENSVVRVFYETAAILRRVWVIGSTSKTVSLGWFMGRTVSGGKESEICGMVSR